MNSRKPGTAADLDNRSRLLHSATDAFAEYGYEGASLRAIADNAGVSFQLIAYYFGSKEELWIATVDFLFERYLETGKGLGFTSSGNLAEQFHNHLRLLLTDMLQRPQLRKIWIQEYLADSPRYHNVIRPKIKHLYETLSLPYFKEVVRLGHRRALYGRGDRGVVVGARPEQRRLSVLRRAHAGARRPARRSPSSGRSTSCSRFSPRSWSQRSTSRGAAGRAAALGQGRDACAPPPDTVVYAWKESREGAPEATRVKQLEIENLHLKQLIGNLSLEKKLLLERLAAIEPKQVRGSHDES